MKLINLILSSVLNFFVSAPKTTQIISILSLLQAVTKHLLAPLVKPVFIPYTPFNSPNNSFVFVNCFGFPLIMIV